MTSERSKIADPSQGNAPAGAERGPGVVRWGVAASTARTLASAGPKVSAAQAAPMVEDIRLKAAASVEHVHRITGLEAARDLRDSEVLVVDRAGWATAAVGGFREMLDPSLRAAMGSKFPQGLPLTLRMGGYGVGAELGALVAFLSGHVLGQYDPFSTSPAAPGGRLLLVAPNIVQTERKLQVDTGDFRLWVALHEQTHRVQFAAAPWLRGHLAAQIGELTSGLTSTQASLGDRVKRLSGGVRSDTETRAPEGASAVGQTEGSAAAQQDPLPEGLGLLDLVAGPQERAALSRVTAVMSLLEGHANVVMDGVDASVIPTVKTIRQRFETRGQDRSALQRLVMRVIGMAAKQRQYQDGARFVRAGVDALGMQGFNVVWEDQANLPSEAELHAPQEWISRMRKVS